MKLTLQKRLAGDVMKCSKNRVIFDQDSLTDIKEAITKADIRTLISQGTIQEKPANCTSRGKARYLLKQKRKGRRSGLGKRKGKATARLGKKESWMNKVRVQRLFLRELKEKQIILVSVYRELYQKSKGGFFRNKRHIKLYLDEHKLTKK